MSIAASSVTYNFGDGTPGAVARSPFHTYTGFNRYTAVQTAGGSTHAVTIVTDSTGPIGSITINGGAASTTNGKVDLTLSATDNSGSVAQMRFSNDGTTFTAWEAYRTNKEWVLSSEIGTKTVYVQFRDALGNLSSLASDTIVFATFQYFSADLARDRKIDLNELTAYGSA